MHPAVSRSDGDDSVTRKKRKDEKEKKREFFFLKKPTVHTACAGVSLWNHHEKIGFSSFSSASQWVTRYWNKTRKMARQSRLCLWENGEVQIRSGEEEPPIQMLMARGLVRREREQQRRIVTRWGRHSDTESADRFQSLALGRPEGGSVALWLSAPTQVQRDKISLSLSVDRLAAKSAAFRVFVSFLSTLLPPSPSLLSRCDFRRGDYFRKGPRMSVVPLLASLLLLVVSPAAGQTGSDDPVTVDVGNRCIDDEGNPQVINRTLFFRTTLLRKPKSS